MKRECRQVKWNLAPLRGVVEEHPLTAPAGLRCPVERAEAEGEPMQEKKIWTLVALAMLTALTLVRPERALDGRVGGPGTS